MKTKTFTKNMLVRLLALSFMFANTSSFAMAGETAQASTGQSESGIVEAGGDVKFGIAYLGKQFSVGGTFFCTLGTIVLFWAPSCLSNTLQGNNNNTNDTNAGGLSLVEGVRRADTISASSHIVVSYWPNTPKVNVLVTVENYKNCAGPQLKMIGTQQGYGSFELYPTAQAANPTDAKVANSASAQPIGQLTITGDKVYLSLNSDIGLVTKGSDGEACNWSLSKDMGLVLNRAK